MTRRPFDLSRHLLVPAALGCAGIATMSGVAEEAAPALSPAAIGVSFQRQVQHELHECRDAVVRIEAIDEHGPLAGSGFFVDPNGLLYTTYTIAGKSHDIVVVRGDQKYPARRLAADPRSGIALVQVDVRTPFLPVAKVANELAVGSPVIACGYPMELPLTPSFGVVGGFDRQYLGRYFATTHIRAQLPVQRGEGGAPLLNMKGEVVGILISSLDGGAASFALPIEAAEKVRRDYVRWGRTRPGWLGLEMEALPEPRHNSTAVVQGLLPGSAAEKGGMKVGDLVLGIGASKITCPEDMLDASFFLSAEDPVWIRLARGDDELTIEVCPSDPPKRPLLAPREDDPGPQLLRLDGQK